MEKDADVGTGLVGLSRLVLCRLEGLSLVRESISTWLIAASVGGLLAAPTSANSAASCTVCHPDIKVEYAQSIHAGALSCTACHGGNPQAMDLRAHQGEEQEVGKLSRPGIVQLCASCHADPIRMKPYGLPTDQYEQYQTSQHGRLLARGDPRTAICTDCHGTHRILPPGEPTSSVFPQNVPATCGRCHANQKLMARYGLDADQVEKFRRSVHGTALFVEEHPAAPTCATCHGTHGAVPPMVGEIGKVCGRCHIRTRDYFNQGPHGKALQAGQMSECISCHGYHDITIPDITLFDTTCQSCHASGSKALLTGQKLRALLSGARQSLQLATQEIVRLEKVFPKVRRYRSRLQQARAYFIEALPVQHALTVARVEDLTRSARSIGEEVRAAVHGVAGEQQVRYIGIALAWAGILFTIAVLYLYKKEKQRDRRKS